MNILKILPIELFLELEKEYPYLSGLYDYGN